MGSRPHNTHRRLISQDLNRERSRKMISFSDGVAVSTFIYSPLPNSADSAWLWKYPCEYAGHRCRCVRTIVPPARERACDIHLRASTHLPLLLMCGHPQFLPRSACYTPHSDNRL